MATDTSSGDKIRFGAFELAVRSGELSKGGVRLPIHGRPVQVLAILLEHPGQMVSREELRNRLWSVDTFVDFDHGLHNAVGRLREVLGDSADRPRFIETLPRHGYRFIAQVESDGAQHIAAAAEKTTATAPKLPKLFRRRMLAPVLVLLCAFVAAAVWFYSRDREQPPVIHSLAVLPLENLSGNPAEEYFADGMTNELITNLSKISALRVISRTSVMRFKGTRRPLPEIAHELNVDAVVEGSILHSGNRVRITAQLIQAPQDKHLWAESYDGDIRDILALQSDVASAIAKQVRVQITAADATKLSRVRQADPEAYQLYLQGLYYWNKGTLASARDSREYFEKAIQKDPVYGRAWVGLAAAYNLMSDYSHAKEAARKALALDDTIGEGHTVYAFATWHGDWDWTTAEQEFKRAVELDPNNATTHHGYAAYLSALRRHDEACAEMQRSLELDPLAPLANTNLGSIYWSSHDFDRAIQQLNRTLETDPNYYDAHLDLGLVYESVGRYDQALVEFEKYRMLAGDPLVFKAAVAHLYAMQHRRVDALKLLSELEAAHKRGDVSNGEALSYDVALVYIGLGDKEHAFQWLQKSYAEHVDDLVEINDDPRMDPLRSDPRFDELLLRIGIPLQGAKLYQEDLLRVIQ